MTRIRSLAGRALRAAKRAQRKVSPPTQLDSAGHRLRQLDAPYGTFWMPGKERPESALLPAAPALAGELAVRGSHVLVVGAGLGVSTVGWARQVGPKGLVSAFEPEPFAYSVLRRNLDSNKIDNTRAFQRMPSDVTPTGGELGLEQLHALRPVGLLSLEDVERSLDVFRALPPALRTMPIVFRSAAGGLQAWVRELEPLGYRVARSSAGVWHFATPSQTGKAPNRPPGSASSPALPNRRLCGFLKSRAEVERCTDFLHRHGYVSHLFACKDWDFAHIVPEVGDGNFLDMGSSESFILKNVMFKGTSGDKYGVDLRPPDFPLYGVRYLVGDLMEVPIEDGFFKYISCLSVVEHQVDFNRFAREAARLLAPGGRLFVTFDYWEPRVVPKKKLYGLAWQPLDARDLDKLIAAFDAAGLMMVEPLDRTLGDAVIREGYYSPEPGIRYTFGMLTLEKRA